MAAAGMGPLLEALGVGCLVLSCHVARLVLARVAVMTSTRPTPGGAAGALNRTDWDDVLTVRSSKRDSCRAKRLGCLRSQCGSAMTVSELRERIALQRRCRAGFERA